MKLFIALLVMCIAVAAPTIESKAQNEKAFSYSAYNPAGAITDTESDTMTVTLNYNYNIVTISAKYVRATGTAAGTITPYYSTDGVVWTTFGSAFTLTNVATQGQNWNLATAARYFRIITTGGTTVTSTVSAKIAVK